MKVWVWKSANWYNVSPTEPKPYTGWGSRKYLSSDDAISVCQKSGVVLFGPMRVRDNVKQFNLTAKEVK